MRFDDRAFRILRNGCFDCRDAFHVFSVYNTSEYKAWISTNNLLDVCQEIIMVILKKQINKYKEKLAIFQSIGIIVIKIRKQGWSPTPVVILVGI